MNSMNLNKNKNYKRDETKKQIAYFNSHLYTILGFYCRGIDSGFDFFNCNIHLLGRCRSFFMLADSSSVVDDTSSICRWRSFWPFSYIGTPKHNIIEPLYLLTIGSETVLSPAIGFMKWTLSLTFIDASSVHARTLSTFLSIF